MTWYKLELGDGRQAFGPTQKIQEAWLTLATAAAKHGQIDHANAVFTSHEPGVSSVTLYFTPSAGGLARAFSATPCDKPDEEWISLSVGDERAWDIHFPGLLERRRRRP